MFAHRFVVLLIDRNQPGGWSLLGAFRDSHTAVVLAQNAIAQGVTDGSVVVDVGLGTALRFGAALDEPS